jgi:hypothetical protein
MVVNPADRPSRPAPASLIPRSTPLSLPSLPLEAWSATKDTLHLWLQVVGKIKLAYVPPKNHWWHVTLHLDARGLTTRRIPRR